MMIRLKKEMENVILLPSMTGDIFSMKQNSEKNL